MRLAQLARKISRTQTEMLDFFRQHGINEYDSLNSRISNDHVQLAFKKFAPHFIDEDDHLNKTGLNRKENDEEEELKKPGEMIPDSDPDETASVDPSETPPVDPDEYEEREVFEREIEKISIPKPKLEGVKVVGKIELPEPKENTSTEEKEETEKERDPDIKSSSRSKTIKKKKFDPGYKRGKQSAGTKSRRNQSRKEKISYREKVKREEQKKEKLKREKKKKEKEKKREHYIKHVQSNIQPKSSQKSPSKTSQTNKEEITMREIPQYKNPLRRLWAWLNGKYDRY